jgi:hypothetical protein
LTFGIGTRVRRVTVEVGEDCVHFLKAIDERQSRPGFSTDGIPFEIPRDVFADVATPVVFVLEELDEQLGVPAERVGDETQVRHD